MKTLTLLALSLFSPLYVISQCNNIFPIAENVKLYYDHFDKKEKLTLQTTQKFTNVTGSGNQMKATVVQELIDAKKKESIGTSESEWNCEGGTVHFTVNNMSFGDGQANVASGMSMEVTGDKMDMPSSLSVGQTLKDITYQMKMSVNGMSMMNKTYAVKDRKVEAEEAVTTAAGTFQCYKMTFTTISQGFGGGTIKSILWYAKDAGLVKGENYSENGKLLSRQILTKIEKGA